MTEAFLYYLWRYQLLQNPLHTVDGEEITLIKTGQLNSDSGSELFKASIYFFFQDDMDWGSPVLPVHFFAE